MAFPADLKYADSHEWARADGEIVTIGITDHAVGQLTDLTFVDLPALGDAVTAGERFGEIESVKAVADLNAPVSGEVVEINDALSGEDGLDDLSQDPYGRGWMIKVRMSNAAELENLLSAEDYAGIAGTDSQG